MKIRIFTGLLLALVTLAILFFTPGIVFTGIITVLILLAAWEWASLFGWRSKKHRCYYTLITMAALIVCFYIPSYWQIVFAFIWWIVALFIVIAYLYNKTISNQIIIAIIGLIVLIPFWTGLVMLRSSSHGPYLILLLLFIVAALDTGAYFTGTWFGKVKLAEKISPKKTFAGLFGGIVFALIMTFVFVYFTGYHPAKHWLAILGLVLLMGVFALLGDLFESMFKRIAGVKDSGSLLPGHGGILDRIDSYTAAVPIFTLAMLYLGYLY